MQDGYRLNLQAIWPVARERQSLELSPVRRDVAPIDPVVLRRAGMHYCSTRPLPWSRTVHPPRNIAHPCGVDRVRAAMLSILCVHEPSKRNGLAFEFRT